MLAHEEKGELKYDFELVYQICNHPDIVTMPHYHDALEIIYIIEGGFNITVGDTVYDMQTGEMVIVNAKEVHAVNVSKHRMNQCVAIKFLPEVICSDSQSLMELKFVIPYILSFSDFKNHYTKTEVESSGIKTCIENIMQADRERNCAYRLEIRINIAQLMLNLIRRVNTVNPIDKDLSDKIRAKFITVFQYISTHYSEKLTAVNLAKTADMRQSDFSANFKKITGKSFNEYLAHIRILKAKQILISTDKNVAEVSYAVGFSNPNYFCNCFKKLTGITPLHFKRLYLDSPATTYYNIEDGQQ